MPTKSFFLPLLSCIMLSSCEAPLVQQPGTVLAHTVWVPRTIAWVRPHPEDAELSRIQYADFPLLCFRDQGKFMQISSYHSLGNGDTIIVATEPGFRVDSGRYRLVALNRVVVTSQPVYQSINFVPLSKKTRLDTLSLTGQSLWYEGIEYRPCTKLSGQSIDSFWAFTRLK